MTVKKVIIVGGVAGGMSAATRLRRLSEDTEIIVFEKGPYVSFANCGLPYYVSGEIADRDELLVQTPESLRARFGLDVRPQQEVLAIDAALKEVTVQDGERIYKESYDKLLLSPGSKPFVPEIPEVADAKNVFVLRNLPDLDQIMARLANAQVQQAVVIGAGFIGLEMAENLAKRGLAVTVVEKAPHLLPPLDEEMAAYVEKELTAKGLRVITGQSAAAFEADGKQLLLEDGSRITSDLTILSVGVQPETTLAKEAGLKLGLRGGILVDENYRTSAADIYAVGDAIVVKQQITGEDALISLASPANRQGRAVADVLAGLPRKNNGSIGTAILRVFDLAAASTGLSERAAIASGLNAAVVHVSGKDHAGYFPGATPLTLKLVFNPVTGQLFGAQGVGEKGVDKRIDILATAIKGGLTIFDLPELEFTYAPPFGSAKDPVNMLGYAAMNLAENLSESLQWHQLNDALDQGVQLLDVRTPQELATGGHFKRAAHHIPLHELRCRLNELTTDQEYIVTCHSGLRSYLAERILKQAGFSVKNLDGGFSLYSTVKPEEIKHV